MAKLMVDRRVFGRSDDERRLAGMSDTFQLELLSLPDSVPTDWSMVLTEGMAITVAAPLNDDPRWTAVMSFVPRRGTVDLAGVAVIPTVGVLNDDDRCHWLMARVKACPPSTSPPDEGLTLRKLRNVRIGDVQTKVRVALAAVANERDPDSVASFFLSKAWAANARKRSGAAGKPDHHFAQLAQRFEALVSAGVRDPVASIANEVQASPSTIRNQLSEARSRGLLTSAGRGRVGGSLTDKGRAALAAKEA